MTSEVPRCCARDTKTFASSRRRPVCQALGKDLEVTFWGFFGGEFDGFWMDYTWCLWICGTICWHDLGWNLDGILRLLLGETWWNRDMLVGFLDGFGVKWILMKRYGQTMINGRFLSHRGTPSHHPFLDGTFHEINKPSILGISPMAMETPIR